MRRFLASQTAGLAALYLFCLGLQVSAQTPDTKSANTETGTINSNASGGDETSPSPSPSTTPFPAGLQILYTGAQSFDAETLDTDLANLIDQSVITALSQPGYSVSQSSGKVTGTKGSGVTAKAVDPNDPTGTVKVAVDAGAQALVSLQYFSDGNRVTLIARLYDTWSGRFLSGGSRSGTVDLGLLNVIDILLADIIDSLAAEGPTLVADFGRESSGPLSKGLLISGPDDGATVSLEGAGELGIIEGGKLRLEYRPLAINQSVRFLVAKEGFYPAQLDMIVTAQTPEPTLPKLYPMGRLGFMFNWDPITLTSFGLSAKFYLLPDSWYLEAGYTFVSSSMRQNIGRSPDEVQVPFTFNHRIDLQTGVYLFFPPENTFRFRLAAGAGFAIFPGPSADPEIMRNLIISLPIAGIDLNLRPFTASISLGAEFAVDIGGRMLYPAGLIRQFMPFRVSLGLLL